MHGKSTNWAAMQNDWNCRLLRLGLNSLPAHLVASVHPKWMGQLVAFEKEAIKCSHWLELPVVWYCEAFEAASCHSAVTTFDSLSFIAWPFHIPKAAMPSFACLVLL